MEQFRWKNTRSLRKPLVGARGTPCQMEQSTALAQPRLLAFGSHSSFPTIDFWQQLAKRKLDEYGLSDAPQPIHASYKPPPQEASHLSRVQLAGDAFASAGAGCVRARGIALLRHGARVDAARAPALVVARHRACPSAASRAPCAM